MNRKLKLILSMLSAAIAVMVLYILLHETGHMLVMLSAGETITEFSILTAHVSGTGGSYTDLSDLWLHANGALLLIAAGAALMVKKGVLRGFIEELRAPR